MNLFPATSDMLLEHMKTTGGFASAADAKRATRVVLTALRERLDGPAAEAIARDLPSSIALPLRKGAYRGDLSPDDLYAAVRRREGTSPGIGVEHAQVVLRTVGDALSDDTRALLERELPPAWTELLFSQREIGEEAPPYGEPKKGQKVRMTLSSAHPGFRDPIAQGSADRAQRHSVARTEQPHAGRKLSSARPK